MIRVDDTITLSATNKERMMQPRSAMRRPGKGKDGRKPSRPRPSPRPTTGSPSKTPSSRPSQKPSRMPSSTPSRKPSQQPSSTPFLRPSSQPSLIPCSGNGPAGSVRLAINAEIVKGKVDASSVSNLGPCNDFLSQQEKGNWYCFVGDRKRITASTCGSTIETIVSVGCSGLSLTSGCGRALVGFQSSPGQEYFVWVGGKNGATGEYEFSITSA